MKMKLYAGSYTEMIVEGFGGHGDGIYVFEFDDGDGSIKLLFSEKTRNPSYVTLSADKNILYTHQELDENKSPQLLTYAVNDKNLELIGNLEITGGFPCYLEKIPNHELLVVACYQTGNVLVFPIDDDCVPLGIKQNIQHEGNSVNKVRQEGPHAHMAFGNPKDGRVYVPDLGIDKIMVYQPYGEELKEVDQIEIPLGCGPRHIAFHPSNNYAFVMNELTGEVSLLKSDGRKFRWVKNVPSFPHELNEDASSSAIKVGNSGEFIYCGDRYHHTISILKFEKETESLTLIDNQGTFGKTPRDFTISPSGKWLLVANQDSDSIIVFEINQETGLLSKVHENNEANSVVCLKF